MINDIEPSSDQKLYEILMESFSNEYIFSLRVVEVDSTNSTLEVMQEDNNITHKINREDIFILVDIYVVKLQMIIHI
jgi:hypothetical protein